MHEIRAINLRKKKLKSERFGANSGQERHAECSKFIQARARVHCHTKAHVVRALHRFPSRHAVLDEALACRAVTQFASRRVLVNGK